MACIRENDHSVLRLPVPVSLTKDREFVRNRRLRTFFLKEGKYVDTIWQELRIRWIPAALQLVDDKDALSAELDHVRKFYLEPYSQLAWNCLSSTSAMTTGANDSTKKKTVISEEELHDLTDRLHNSPQIKEIGLIDEA